LAASHQRPPTRRPVPLAVSPKRRPWRDAAACPQMSDIPDSHHGRQRRNRPGPCRRFRRRPTRRRGGRGGPTPTAPHVRPTGTVSAGVCAPTGQPVRSPDTTADASAAAPPLQLAVVRHGPGHRPAMLNGSRTPAVRSAASGPVGVHWQNDQQPCPSRLRQKGRSGCVQAAVMEPVGGHLTAAGRHPARTPVRPQDDLPAQDRTPQAADGQSAEDSGSLQLPLLCSRPALRAPPARQRPEGHWHVGLTPHRGQRRSLAARISCRHLRSRHLQAGIRSFHLWPNLCPAWSDTGYRHAGHRTRARQSDDAAGATSAQAPP
jgi:hypothetical protein